MEHEKYGMLGDLMGSMGGMVDSAVGTDQNEKFWNMEDDEDEEKYCQRLMAHPKMQKDYPSDDLRRSVSYAMYAHLKLSAMEGCGGNDYVPATGGTEKKKDKVKKYDSDYEDGKSVGGDDFDAGHDGPIPQSYSGRGADFERGWYDSYNERSTAAEKNKKGETK